MTSSPSHPASAYRKEIDGLRALAVLPVVLFHFSIPGFGGGFVGVDIFFVISGFLIGGLLWSELTRDNNIALGRFFMRRIRRLAPAYFAMAIVSLVASWFILLPYEFREFGKELIASTVYLSNVHFFREAGYFDVASDQKVLLHTWSLAVEEQFYLFLPVFLLILRPVRRVVPAVLMGIGLISLVACLVMTSYSQTAAFYLFPFRAWELLAGVCLAIYAQQRAFDWSLHPLISWAGLALIVGSVTLIPSGPQFPGFLALFPVLGALCIIGNGRNDNAVNRGLQHPILIFFGLISYSLYLWHWPVITLATYYVGGDLSLTWRVILMGLVVALAWVSLCVIEAPIRRGWLTSPALLTGAVLASGVTLGAGALIYLQDGMIDRYRPEVRAHIEASFDFNQDWRRCTTPGEGDFAGIEICPIGPEGPPQVVIWGDSHVRAFKEGLEQAAFEADTPALLMWRAGCPPLFGLAKEEPTSTRIQNETCARNNSQLKTALANLPEAKTLLLIGRWTYYAEGQGIGQDRQNSIRLFATEDGPLVATDQSELLVEAWDHSTDILAGYFENIFILEQVPEIDQYASWVISRKLALGHLSAPDEIEALTQVSRTSAKLRTRAAHRMVERVAEHPQVHLIRSWQDFCSEAVCAAVHDGVGRYFDNNHITNTQAKKVRRIFDPVFQAAASGI